MNTEVVEEFGRLSVQYRDFSGEVAIDLAGPDHPSLEALARLNEDEWLVVGIEWSNLEGHNFASVLAAKRAPVVAADGVRNLASIDVHRFPVAGDDLFPAFKRFSVAASRSAAHLNLVQDHKS